MTIAIGGDHGAYDLKKQIIDHLQQRGIKTLDMGAYDTSSSDYPDYAPPVCNAVLAGEADLGIVICGTGIGISISANKIHGIRCALLGDTFSAKMAREHNDANVMAIGARVLGVGLALQIVDTFIDSDFSHDERHSRRIEKIMDLEKR
jgi:ribose 5-phosphate isomerase B